MSVCFLYRDFRYGLNEGITDMTEIFKAQGNAEEALRIAEAIDARLPHIAEALRELVSNGTTTINPDGSIQASSD